MYRVVRVIVCRRVIVSSVKTRLQVPGGAARYGGLANCWKTIYAEEGFAAFFKGAVPRMCVTAPLFGIALLCFEMQKEYILNSRKND